MKKEKNHGLARLTAVLLALTVLLGLGATATAVEETTGNSYVAKDGYVYHFGSGSGIYQYAQFSNYVPTVSYDGHDHWGYSIIFGLKNTVTNQTFEKLYCMDMPVDADDSGTYYRPLNLSDSTYAAALADKLRGIVLHTYPYITVDALATASGVEGLTRDEAITGSQLAIWKTTHGDTLTIKDFGANDRSYNSVSQDVQDRIQALYNYLMALPEQPAKKSVVSEASFTNHDTAPTVTDNGDGTYNVTVETTVTVQLDSGDSLTLTAHMADGAYSASTTLSNGTNNCTLTIQNVPAEYANSTVTLAIDGTQTLNDVYLVDADGIRGVSQSMIGALHDTVPVHAETKVEPDRVLNLYKTAGGVPLAGISFEVYYVGSLADYETGKLDKKPTDATKYATTTNLVGTLTTNSEGYASLNFGTTDGVYLLKELPDDRVTGPCSPFFVVLPWDYDDGDNDPYTLTVYPKNTLSCGGIELVKVDADNNKALAGATFEVYREATSTDLANNAAYVEMTVGNVSRKLIQVEFYTDEEMSGEKVTSLTTGTDGKGHIYGLAYGTYYLVETEAPAGYNKLSEPTAFEIKASSNGTVNTLTVKNSSGTVLPSTGGMGTTLFTAAGLLLMAVPAAALVQRKRSN